MREIVSAPRHENAQQGSDPAEKGNDGEGLPVQSITPQLSRSLYAKSIIAAALLRGSEAIRDPFRRLHGGCSSVSSAEA
jgi:hypothetical protein